MSSLALSVIWQILTIWCNNIGGMLVGRFLSAFFGSSFLSVAGGVVKRYLYEEGDHCADGHIHDYFFGTRYRPSDFCCILPYGLQMDANHHVYCIGRGALP